MKLSNDDEINIEIALERYIEFCVERAEFCERDKDDAMRNYFVRKAASSRLTLAQFQRKPSEDAPGSIKAPI